MDNERKFSISLFGSFVVRNESGGEIRISGAKQKALIAILATSANGAHSRAWLQETLWSLSGVELGRASLRRALADLKVAFSNHYETLFTVSNSEIRLNKANITLEGSRLDGEFLEGISLHEIKFQDWLSDKRLNYLSSKSTGMSGKHAKILPKIAVVPFATFGTEPFGISLSDMIAMEISRALSRSNVLQITSHLSSRRLTKVVFDLESANQILNVDYLIYGNIRTENDVIRLDVDFIHTRTGTIEWTRQFKTNISDFVTGSSEIVSRIGNQIGLSVLAASIELAGSKPLPQVESHALFVSATSLMHQHRLAPFSKARSHLEELIKRLPQVSYLHAWLAKWYLLSLSQGWSVNPKRDYQIAQDYTKNALDIDSYCPTSLTIDGMIQGDRNSDFTLAESRFTEALEIDPNNSLAWLMYSRMKAFSGDGVCAVQYARKACALSPIDPQSYFYNVLNAMANNVAGDYANGRNLAQKSIDENPRHTSSYRVLAISQQMLGLDQEAKETVSQLLRLEPNLTIESYLLNHPASMQDIGQQWAGALQAAGVPIK